MQTAQSMRNIPGADMAVLFVHGILGTPDHFLPFLPLVPENWSVCNLLLKGHGGTAKDFSAASMEAWKQQVHEALAALLSTHKRVVIAAHSMGTLFALQEAMETPVSALFLLNVPLRIRITPRMPKTTWRVFRGNIPADDPWLQAAQKAYGIERDPNILHYLGWIPRYLELFGQIGKTKKELQKLSVPTRVYLSRMDEMVSPETARLFDKIPCATVKHLTASGHYYYSPEDLQLLRTGFQDLIQKMMD